MPTNELANAASPYLLQHQHNPVHWMEWGDAALARARESRRPILLSVGYAACHWCHVMAQESFEDQATAEVMNALFVNIKVDREERPDVDHFYMSALQSLGERGGWPLTMFLTPDGAPFWGGTYFPKRSAFGRPSFQMILRSVASTYADKPSSVQANAQAIMAAVADATPDAGVAPTLDAAVLDGATTQAAAAMDRVNGGFGGAPKFPNASLLELLLRGGVRMRSPDTEQLVFHTLRRIAQGGIYDHLGGGFARYSTDDRWLVPHFEKMLYDNAQLIDLMALAYAATGDDLFRTRIAETVAWLRREMTVEGALAASLDADSEHVEGKFYVWTRLEIDAVLGADAELFCRAYDVTAGGNWQDEHTGQSVVVLNRLDTPSLSPGEEARLPQMRAALLRARETRVRPALDDKVLTDWNALAITGLAHASGLCGEPEWLDLAQDLYATIVERMSVGPAALIHARRGERRGKEAFASDYAALANAALALAEASATRPDEAQAYVEQARGWLATLSDRYANEAGVLFMTAEHEGGLPVRLAPLVDEATPNANGVYASALVRMAAITGEHSCLDQADRLFEGASAAVLRAPLAHCAILNALDFRLNGAELVLAGRDIGALAAAAQRLPWLNRTLTTTALLAETDIVGAQTRAAGKGAAFLCRGQACSAPVHDPAQLARLVSGP